jgi:hypothetical protein
MSAWKKREFGDSEEREAGGFALSITNQSDRGCGWCWHVSLSEPDRNGEIAEIGGSGKRSADEAKRAAEQYAVDFCARTLAALTGADDGVDPTTPELLSPRGNNGVVSAEICFDALLLVGDADIDESTIAAWTQEQRNVAYDWAMRTHLRASDNDDVFLPERPDFIPWQVNGALAAAVGGRA